MLVRFFPHGLLGIGLAAVFAATISTGTSMLHATATLIVNDIYVPLGKSERNDQSILVTSRICVFAVALFALSISMFSSNIVNICYIGGLFYGVSAFVPMVLGLYSKFVTGKAALISMDHDCCAEFVVGVFSIFSYQCACTDSVQCLWTGCQRRDDLHHIGAYK